MPVDMLRTKRIMMKLRDILPKGLIENLVEKELNSRFDHAAYSLKPKHAVFAQHPMVNDEMPNRLASGTLNVRPDIKTFTENGIIFDDGTKEENIDIVVLATGYIFGFPFLDKSVIEVKENHVDLCKYMFLPQLEKQTLCVVGFIQPLGAIMPIAELQCRLATRVFQVRINANELMKVYAI
jgi:dimethylaniline monooxygenase (N-oxide forming)